MGHLRQGHDGSLPHRGANEMGPLKESWPYVSAEMRTGWIVTVSADHGNGETERAESVGKGGAPGLAALPVDRSVPIDRFAEGDLKAGGNDLANGEAQAEPGRRSRSAQGQAPGVGFSGEVCLGLIGAVEGGAGLASASGAGGETITNSALRRRHEADGRKDQTGQAHENLHRG